MMKMLAEGGLSVVTDGLRSADEDNPNGYYELEAVKQMPAGNVAWLADAGGRVVKVISALLEHLPSTQTYKFIFIEREIKEILASQQKMLKHRNESFQVDDAEIEAQFRKHLSVIKPWLVRQPNMETLFVGDNGLMEEPVLVYRRLVELVGTPLFFEKMPSVPSKALYRNRVSEV